jgi:acid phosphatase class B
LRPLGKCDEAALVGLTADRHAREAMAKLLEVDDVRAVLAGQVLYPRYFDVADAIVAVAERLWFVVLRGA